MRTIQGAVIVLWSCANGDWLHGRSDDHFEIHFSRHDCARDCVHWIGLVRGGILWCFGLLEFGIDATGNDCGLFSVSVTHLFAA